MTLVFLSRAIHTNAAVSCPFHRGRRALPFKRVRNRGGWTVALKHGPEMIVLRRIDCKFPQLKINKINQMCSIIDLDAYDEIEDVA